ncbi:LPXTG cell wall anchor domain-containing protein [Streptomyces lunaelactis]|nr:LPXTG cell wall anchor domain-containing protein [Streptomyces lunaelactis]NUK07200.1 LPXTG cell wall anchor domain-containing protein [Streptomyces lunaelactis]NUK16097.1 LPXTG cell wall anchor domain-containing protein [Streptomyces lunaelactis]NUK23391.1 LPXTG cell wall anchor domain-containing protein [Streptomyces lunaelactis]NUK34923.1 LPXTG cell wall anchor domain-containing protein [Streptomyces lunaelactis]
MSVGGVDFSKQPKRNMTKPRFDTEHRYLPRETKSSVRTLTDNAKDGEKNLLLLGGNTVSSDLSGGDTSDPKPTPTPTPTKPGEPTDKPTDPTTPPATGGSSGGTGGKNPQGDLADTGSSTPVGMIAGLAAALAAIGGGLVWWKRRRTADQE